MMISDIRPRENGGCSPVTMNTHHTPIANSPTHMGTLGPVASGLGVLGLWAWVYEVWV